MPQATSDLTTSMETRVEHTTDKTNLPSSSDISSYADFGSLTVSSMQYSYQAFVSRFLQSPENGDYQAQRLPQTSHAAESSEDTESTEGELTMILLFEFEL